MKKKIFLSGTSIERYSIVVSKKCREADKDAADILCEYIEKITGNRLEIISDGEFSDFEIVLGNTERNTPKTCKALSELKNDGLAVLFDNGRLYFIGEGEFGTVNAVCRFLEKIGCRFYTDSVEEIIGTEDIYLSSDFSFCYSPALMYRRTDWNMSRNIRLKLGLNAELSVRSSIIGNCHNLGALANTGSSGQPCLSDETVYQTVLKNVKKLIRENPGCRVISVTQNDNFGYCKCEKCLELAEKENQSGVMLNFINRLAAEIEKDYPEIYLLTFAYQYTRTPPKTIKPRKNVIIWLCSIECCFSHMLADEKCEKNKNFVADINRWGEISDNIYIWDYSTNYAHYNAPFPDFGTLLPNARFYAEHNAIGVYEEGGYAQSENGEFQALRAYLTAKILWNPYMSNDEYDGHMNEFLSCYYGKGWRYVKEYIVKTTECAEKMHLTIYIRPDKIFTDKDGNPDLDTCIKLDGLWEKAISEAESEEQRRHCSISRIQSKYIVTRIRSIINKKADPDENRALIEMLRSAGVVYHCEWGEIARVDNLCENKAVSEWCCGPWNTD